jgi:glucosylceramidase
MITLHGNIFKRACIVALLSFTFFLGATIPAEAALKAKCRVTTDAGRWASEVNTPITSSASGTSTIVIDTATKSQTINGFGGCFNEHGGKALKAVDTSLSNKVLRELFDTVSGCKFNLCRMPIGASDFSIQTASLNRWYSLNETANDTAMTTISIARDKIYLIPFIKSAMVYRPDLKMWASPWSPPKWMKVNNDVPAANFIQTPKMLAAYALYLSKGVKLFQAEGVNLKGLAVQNEPYTNNSYPNCFWSSAEVRDFIKLYLGPRFTADQVNCEIWSPTMNNGSLSEYTTWLSDQGSAQYIKAVCFQWEGENAIAGIHAAYPNLTLYQTENKCGSHEDNWAYAENPTFQQMKWYFDRGANGFMQWNMVLDQTGLSAWGWAQCSMVSVDTTKKTVTFNPQHYCAKHFSYYVQPGAKKIKTSGTFVNQVGFKNPDGSVVIVANNSGTGAVQLAVSLGASTINVSMPAHSFDTYVFYDSLTSVAAGPSKNGPQPHATSLLKIAKSGNAISIVPQGAVFDLRVVGLDGRVKSSLSSKTADALHLRSGEMAPGIYFIKGMVDGKNCTAALPIQE